MEAELDADCGIRLGGGLCASPNPEEMPADQKEASRRARDGASSSTVLLRNELLAVAPYLGPPRHRRKF